MPARLTLPARLRLRHKGDFAAAYARGRRMSDGFFAVTVMRNDVGVPRLGLAVGGKLAGNAGARERLRGLLRGAFRLPPREVPAVGLVVGSARPGGGGRAGGVR